MLAVLIIAFIIFVFHVIQDFRYEDGKNVKVMFRSFSIKKCLYLIALPVYF